MISSLPLIGALLIGCERIGGMFEPPPAPRPADPSFTPAGRYVRRGGKPASFTISRGSGGAWVVETEGRPDPGDALNACRSVSVGTMEEGRLVSSSDLDRSFTGQLRQAELPDYSGFFIDFYDGRAEVSGPEATERTCWLAGTYFRQTRASP